MGTPDTLQLSIMEMPDATPPRHLGVGAPGYQVGPPSKASNGGSRVMGTPDAPLPRHLGVRASGSECSWASQEKSTPRYRASGRQVGAVEHRRNARRPATLTPRRQGVEASSVCS